jgi:hypothetical protein
LTLLAIGVVVVLILFATGTTKDRLDVQCDVNSAQKEVAVRVSYDSKLERDPIIPAAGRDRLEIDFGDGHRGIKYVVFHKQTGSTASIRHGYASPGTYKLEVYVGGSTESCTIELLRQAND